MHIRPGTHGWYVVHNGELVDGPYASKREAEEIRIVYLEDPGWKRYYTSPDSLQIVAEVKNNPGRPKSGRTWKQVLRP